MRRRLLAIPVLAGALLCLPPASAQTLVPSHGQPKPAAPAPKPATGTPKTAPSKPEAVAFVNGVPLTADRLGAAMNELMPYGAYHAGAAPERVAQLRKQALDRVIDEELQFQEATRLKLVARKADVDGEYARVRRRYKTEQEYLAALKKAGITDTFVRAEARRRALIAMAGERAVSGKCGVTTAEARAYYDQNTTKFVMPEQVHVFTITVAVEPSAPRSAWDEARKKTENLLARLRGGADFAALAREHSTDPNRANGGDLGWVHRGRLAEEFEKALAGAAPGATIGPVETLYGYHLLRLAEVRPPVQRSFAEVQERLVKDLGDKKCVEAREAWLADLRGRARIVIPEPAAQK